MSDDQAKPDTVQTHAELEAARASLLPNGRNQIPEPVPPTKEELMSNLPNYCFSMNPVGPGTIQGIFPLGPSRPDEGVLRTVLSELKAEQADQHAIDLIEAQLNGHH